MSEDASVSRLKDLLLSSRRIAALSGAGISTSAGVPDFRSPETGLWNLFDDMDAFTASGFIRRPHKLYQLILRLLPSMGHIQPTAAHRWLADLEREGKLIGTITQNVDGLHQLAGSSRVVELHGNCTSAHCIQCGASAEVMKLLQGLSEMTEEAPTCELCGGIYKPDVILFGDMLPEGAYQAAVNWAQQCDLFLVLGSSLLVSPANDLPFAAVRSGAKLAIINLQETLMDHGAAVVIRDELDSVVKRLQNPH